MSRPVRAAGPPNHRGIPAICQVFAVAGLALVVQLPMAAVRAIPAGGINTPPPTRVDRFNPDQQVCTPEAIRQGYLSQMQPWADQPPQVVARLREVQLEMMRSTLRRCVSKGLMDRTAAEQLFAQLIADPSSGSTPSQAPTAAPVPATSTAPAAGR